MSDTYIGEIRFIAFSYAPQGWLYCNGQSVSISQYQSLYAVIGLTYGGDGVQHFNLPKLNGRGLVGTGKNSVSGTDYAIAQKGGAEQVSLTPNTMPVHSHSATFAVTKPFTGTASIAVNAGQAGQASPNNAYLASSYNPTGRTPTPFNTYSAPVTTSATLNGVSSTGTPNGVVTVSPAGANVAAPVSTLTPMLSGGYIIAWNGLFPSHP